VATTTTTVGTVTTTTTTAGRMTTKTGPNGLVGTTTDAHPKRRTGRAPTRDQRTDAPR
jgi:hypothetical protein